jgi:hypothetical protein
MSYYLIHQTHFENLESILKDDALLSIEKSKAERNYSSGIIEEQPQEIQAQYQNKIFTNLLVPIKKILNSKDSKLKESRFDESQFDSSNLNSYSWLEYLYPTVYLIFDYKKVLKNSKGSKFYCNGWNLGKNIESRCFDYDNKISPTKNVNAWVKDNTQNFKNQLMNGRLFLTNSLHNEVVIEDSIPLKNNLLYIYIHIPTINSPYFDWYEYDKDKRKEHFDFSEWSEEDVNKIEELKNKYSQYEWRIELPEIPFFYPF